MEQYPPQPASDVTPPTVPLGTTPTTPNVPPVTTPSQEPPVEPKKTNTKVLVIGVVVLLLIALILGAGYFMLVANKKAPAATSTPYAVPTTIASPTPTPITSSNADDTLNNTDASVGASLNQMNSDVNTLNSINATQDNPSSF